MAYVQQETFKTYTIVILSWNRFGDFLALRKINAGRQNPGGLLSEAAEQTFRISQGENIDVGPAESTLWLVRQGLLRRL